MCYSSKIGLKSGKFPIFWKNARILKKVRNVFLELGWSLRPEIWTVGTSSKNLGMLRGIFEKDRQAIHINLVNKVDLY